MDKFVISGRRKLSGSVALSGSKNAALPIMAACLLADGPCELDRVPDLPAGATAADLLLDSDVRVRRTILTFINDKQFDPATPLADNDRVTFLSPLSGG